jgi:hypothetical protein
MFIKLFPLVWMRKGVFRGYNNLLWITMGDKAYDHMAWEGVMAEELVEWRYRIKTGFFPHAIFRKTMLEKLEMRGQSVGIELTARLYGRDRRELCRGIAVLQYQYSYGKRVSDEEREQILWDHLPKAQKWLDKHPNLVDWCVKTHKQIKQGFFE